MRNRGPGTRRTAGAEDGVADIIVVGLRKALRFDDHLSAVRTTVDPFDGRRRQWLRRNTCCRSSDKTGSVECRRIIVRRRLDIVSEERVLPDHEFTLFVFRADGFLTAILRVRKPEP